MMDATRPARWLVSKTSEFLDARVSRRSFISRATLLGTAAAASGCAVFTQPGAPWTYVTDCPGGSLCRDGYTEFCCVINQGQNTCPPNTVASGWWRADGSAYCPGGTRFFVDCNNYGGALPCHCADGCGTRKVWCNRFRYGQCNQQIGGTGVIACRVVTCTPPYQIAELNCSPSGATDGSTANHNADCARYTPPASSAPPPPPPAVEVSLGDVVSPDPTLGTLAVLVRGNVATVNDLRFDPGTGWGTFNDRGNAFASRVVGATKGDGSMWAFVRSNDLSLGTNFSPTAGNWNGWTSLGGTLSSDPAAITLGSETWVFVRGADKALYYQRHNGTSWSGWNNLGGYITSDIVLNAIGGGFFVFARNSDYSSLAWQYWTGTQFSGWLPLGGALTSDLAAVTMGGAAWVFGRGIDGASLVGRRFESGAWSEWQNLGGVSLTSDPTAIVVGSSLWVFGRGGDSQTLVARKGDGTITGWGPWQTLNTSSQLTSDVSAIARPNGDVWVFARDFANALITRIYDSGGATWGAWQSLGGAIYSTRGMTNP